MSIKVKEETAGKTVTLFNEGVDYSQPSEDRPFSWRLEDGHIIYLNLEQFQFMVRPINNEKKRKEREKRCIVPSERTGMFKVCRGDCSTCRWFLNPKSTYGSAVSLDELYENYEYEVGSNSMSALDSLLLEERNEAIHKAIDELEDDIDRKIIKMFMDNYTERKMAEIIGLSQKGINKRKAKIFDILREKLKNYY